MDILPPKPVILNLDRETLCFKGSIIPSGRTFCQQAVFQPHPSMDQNKVIIQRLKMLGNVEHNMDRKGNADEDLDRKLLSLDLSKVNIGTVPKDFISFMFSRNFKAGDFFIAKSSLDWHIISIKARDGRAVNFTVEKYKEGYRVRGFHFVSGKTIGEVLCNIRKSQDRSLFGSFPCEARPRRLLTFKFLRKFRIFDKKRVIGWTFEHEDRDFIYHRANFSVNNGYEKVILKEGRAITGAHWKQYMFDELKASFLAEDLKLPVRSMLGVITWCGGGFLMYSDAPGRCLPRFLDENMDTLSCWAKIKLCIALARVLSQVYKCNMYCGIVELGSFHINFLQAESYGRIEPVLAEGKDLIPVGKTAYVDRGDFTRMPPEVKLTREVTPLTASYTMGLVLQAVLENGFWPSPEDANYELAQSIAETVIEKCLDENAAQRPTLQEISTELDAIEEKLEKAMWERWIPI